VHPAPRSSTTALVDRERLSHAGAVPNTALAVVTELFRDWSSPLADKAREVIYWYFAEVTKMKADTGVSEVEKQAAGAPKPATSCSAPTSPSHQPVELAARKSPTQHEPSCGLAVVLPGGRRIEIHPDFDTSTFERLVSALERV
jgi:hypothetical protein